MVFPKTLIDETKRQTERDLTQFDLDFDLPDHLLSTREVAQVLKISEPNVKMRLHRARLILRKQLEDR